MTQRQAIKCAKGAAVVLFFVSVLQWYVSFWLLQELRRVNLELARVRATDTGRAGDR